MWVGGEWDCGSGCVAVCGCGREPGAGSRPYCSVRQHLSRHLVCPDPRRPAPDPHLSPLSFPAMPLPAHPIRLPAKIPQIPNDTLRGRVAIVTGSTRGIGLSCSEALAACGVRVVVCGKSDKPQPDLPGTVSSVAKDLAEKYKVETLGLKCNVRDDAAVQALVQKTLDRFGRLGHPGAQCWGAVVAAAAGDAAPAVRPGAPGECPGGVCAHVHGAARDAAGAVRSDYHHVAAIHAGDDSGADCVLHLQVWDDHAGAGAAPGAAGLPPGHGGRAAVVHVERAVAQDDHRVVCVHSLQAREPQGVAQGHDPGGLRGAPVPGRDDVGAGPH